MTEDGAPALLIECKLADRDIDRGLRYLNRRFPEARAIQVTLEGERDYVTPEGIRAMPAIDFLRTLV